MSNEISRLIKQFTDLQHGESWIGNNFKVILHGLDPVTATRPLPEDGNNIWQIISHLIYWRTIVVNRLNGSLSEPTFPDFKLPEETNEENWKQLLIDFESVYHLLRNAIQHFKEENLYNPSPKEGQTYHQLILGCLQHDAYHLGQMALMKRVQGV